MMPLWTTASLSVACGWALVSFGLPWVAQRVWPMPIRPDSGELLELGLQVAQLAFGAAAVEPAVLEGRHAGGIVAAVFKPLERFDDLRRDRRRADNADDSAHVYASFWCDQSRLRLSALSTRSRHAALKSTCVTDCDTAGT